MRFAAAAAAAFLACASVAARTIVITVGGSSVNETNATAIFDPQTVDAVAGDTVVFNFTFGNHTVTQSEFATPCIHAHDTDSSVNGFDSAFRDAGSEQAVTQLQVPITKDNENDTIWFYDANTCAEGGVGAINVNESSSQPFDAFVRNAERLNGTAPPVDNTSSSTDTTGATGTDGSSPATTSASSNGARGLTAAFTVVIPLLLAAIAIAL